MKRYLICVLLTFSSLLYASVGDTITFMDAQYVVTADDTILSKYEVRIGRYLTERISVPAVVRSGIKSYAVTAVPRYFDSTTCTLKHYQKIDYSRCNHLISLAWQATDEIDIDTLILPPNLQNWPIKAFYSADPVNRKQALTNQDKLQKGIHRIFSSGTGNPNLGISFSFCGALQEVDLSSYTASIEAEYTIQECYFLEKCILPNSLKSLDLNGLMRLTSINLPDSLESFPAFFGNGIPISHLHIGSNVKEIGPQAFIGWQYLDSISVDPANQWFCAIDGVLFSKDTTELIKYPYSRKASIYVLPQQTKVIVGCTFYVSWEREEYTQIWHYQLKPSAGSLHTLVINDGLTGILCWNGFANSSIRKIRNLENSHVTYISGTAFENSNIDTLIMPATLKRMDVGGDIYRGISGWSIAQMRNLRCLDFSRADSLSIMGKEAMMGDTNLDSLDLLHCSLLTRLPSGVCKGDSSLRFVALPRYIDTIGQEAFSGCVSLNKIICPAFTPIRLSPGMNVFEGINTSACELIVPSRSVSLYQRASVWKDFRITSNGLYIIEGLPSDTLGGTVTGTGAYRLGETAILTATPEEGYEFVGWSDGATDNPRQINATQDTTLMAVFQLISGLQPAKNEKPSDVQKRIINGNLYIQKGQELYYILGGEMNYIQALPNCKGTIIQPDVDPM